MNKFLKSAIALSVYSLANTSMAHAATYEVEPVAELATHEYTYGQNINDNGDTVISASLPYNFPILIDQLSLTDLINIQSISFRASVFGLDPITTIEPLISGEGSANDLAWAVLFLNQSDQVSSLFYQKANDIASFVDLGSGLQQLAIFDQPLENTDGLTQSSPTYINGITNENWLFGNASAPSLPTPYDSSLNGERTYWLRAFESKAFLSIDGGNSTFAVEAPETSHGGESGIFDMNNNREAVGYASIDVVEAVRDIIQNDTEGENGCLDPDRLEIESFETCEQLIRTSVSLYRLQAYKWQFDASGQVISQEPLGLLVESHPDDLNPSESYAQAINSHGVAVGYATGWLDDTVVEPAINQTRSEYAVLYRDGEVIDFTGDHDTFFSARAFDINDEGIAVGHVTRSIAGVARTSFYYIDTNLAELATVIPDGFFNGSASSAKAINEQGLIVGQGQVENHIDTSGNTRRTAGFLYDINNDTFNNLNDFLACDSPYDIFEATDINELNEITASAVVSMPRRDAKGDLVFDESGNQLFEDVIKAVKLTPTNGVVENCEPDEEDVFKRQGASFHWLFILSLCVFRIFRK
jgi:hypothetical protein